MAVAEPFHGLVQFPHPGREHNAKPFVGDVFPWNVGDHRRKFLQASGSWRGAATSGEGLLRFWGEYEPPSRVAAVGPKDGALPQWVHDPLYPPARGDHRQNTDPIPLDGFWYSNCKQHHFNDRHAPTILQRMIPGTVVLFGSKLDHHFVLDTVFVVAEAIPYGRDDIEHLDVPQHVKDLALRPLYSSPHRQLTYVLYRGATAEQPVNGTFSFVPALPVTDEGTRFARPALDLGPGVLEPNLAMGKRVLPASGPTLRRHWQDVLEAVLDAGLVAGTALDMPIPAVGGRGTDATTGKGQPC